MKNRALFSLKDKSKKLKCRLLQFLFGVLRVKTMAVVPLLLFLIILKQRKVKTVRRALYALVIEDKKSVYALLRISFSTKVISFVLS